MRIKKYVGIERKDSKNFDFSIENYHGSYSKLLDRFSEEAMKFDEQQIQEYRNSLACFFDRFEVTSTQSSKVALLESFYIVYEKLDVDKPITSAIYRRILQDPIYISYVRQRAVKNTNMNGRWKRVYEIWTGNDEASY